MPFKTELKHSDVTPKAAFLNRRQIIAGAAAGVMAGPASARALGDIAKTSHGAGLATTSLEDISSYCNFYEFGVGKDDPPRNAQDMVTVPWSVEIAGLVDRPGTYGLEDILRRVDLEERIYRFRCVEAWAMVIPWVGFELNQLLDMAGVQPSAKYVAFETAVLPDVMEGISRGYLDWPYREALRMDEAMHPLTLMSVGIYGEELRNQNGAPIRLVVPWKYGFKSIKSVVKVELTSKRPPNSWNMQNPREYGFYSNVNPLVDHPRWSQASERRIGDGVFARRHPTLMFNGYGDEVASLYAGMDLTREF